MWCVVVRRRYLVSGGYTFDRILGPFKSLTDVSHYCKNQKKATAFDSLEDGLEKYFRVDGDTEYIYEIKPMEL